MLYGAETWATTKAIEKEICRCDQRMLRHMALVWWEDRVTTKEKMWRSEENMWSQGYNGCAEEE